MAEKMKILAVASAGGHWVQLLRLTPSFEGADVEFVSTRQADTSNLPGIFHQVQDANNNNKFGAVVVFFQILVILLKMKPDFIITTGALPGLVAIAIGRCLGKKTIWLDSIANSEQLSKSGRFARYFSSLWLTQWAGLESTNGPKFLGRVI